MKVAGVNLTNTSTGLRLLDGNTALMEDGQLVVAIAEERISRRKYDGGFARSLRYCLDAAGWSADDLDIVAGGICCDTPVSVQHLHRELQAAGFDISPEKLVCAPSHHLMHALSGYYSSPFDSALILVADGEGVVLGEPKSGDYWANSLERTSWFLARDGKVSFLGREAEGPGDLGVGAAYGYFTRAIGFDHSKAAGKTMAMAGYGSGRFSGVEVFDVDAVQARCRLEPIAENPALSVRRLLYRATGVDFPELPVFDPPQDWQKDLAELAQNELERTILARVRAMLQSTGESNLCVTGGVGLNCVLNGRLLGIADQVHTPPYPDDTGQSIGLAIYGSQQANPRIIRKCHDADLGRTYGQTDIRDALGACSADIQVEHTASPADVAAELVAKGKVVAWFQGAAEMGPRALGRRSIIADARVPGMREHLNRNIKRREGFRPYGVSVLSERAEEYFEGASPSPFMSFAFPVRQHLRGQIPSAVHIDGTCRIQTVKAGEDRFRKLIESFGRLTNLPLMINTSFNLDGEPIVETPQDALACFLRAPIDALILQDCVIRVRYI